MKRITIFAGHYGSGKTNIAVNAAIENQKNGIPTVIADLDIVNPYFRTKDSEERLKKAGIKLISSQYANSNVDLPAVPQEMYSVVDDKSRHYIVDLGGDDRGAYALGRYADKIKEENDYEFVFVFNKYRPLTATAEDAIEVMREIEQACNMEFTAIVNNSNIGEKTQFEDVLKSVEECDKLSLVTGKPVLFTSVRKELEAQTGDFFEKLFFLELQKKII